LLPLEIRELLDMLRRVALEIRLLPAEQTEIGLRFARWRRASSRRSRLACRPRMRASFPETWQKKLHLFLGGAELRQDAEVFERGGVAGDSFPAGDFLQKPAHDFFPLRVFGSASRSGFRPAWRPADDGADVLFSARRAGGVGGDALLHGDKADDGLALEFIGRPTTADSATAACEASALSNFRRAEPMARDVQHVVDAPHDQK